MDGGESCFCHRKTVFMSGEVLVPAQSCFHRRLLESGCKCFPVSVYITAVAGDGSGGGKERRLMTQRERTSSLPRQHLPF